MSGRLRGVDTVCAITGPPVTAGPRPPPAPLDEAAQADFRSRAESLAPRFRTELLPPPGGD